MAATTRRAELAAFLRSRRERVSPGAGRPAAGTRRRTPGLRREEVAQLAGVGVTWYTWLEQGRQINASSRCSTRWPARCGWTRPSGSTCTGWPTCPDAASVAGAGDGGCEQVPPEVQQILDSLVPLPASVINERFDLLAWNARVRGAVADWSAPRPASATSCGSASAPRVLPPVREPGRAAGHAGGPVARALRPARRRARLDRVRPAAAGAAARSSPGCGPSTTWPARRPTSRSSGTRRTSGWHDDHQPGGAGRRPAPGWWCTRPPTRSAAWPSAGCSPGTAWTPATPAGPPTSAAGNSRPKRPPAPRPIRDRTPHGQTRGGQPVFCRPAATPLTVSSRSRCSRSRRAAAAAPSAGLSPSAGAPGGVARDRPAAQPAIQSARAVAGGRARPRRDRAT